MDLRLFSGTKLRTKLDTIDGYDEGYEKGISIGLTTGREEGISIGLERGAYQTKLETARSLLLDGFSAEMISKYTSLPIEAIQQLVD